METQTLDSEQSVATGSVEATPKAKRKRTAKAKPSPPATALNPVPSHPCFMAEADQETLATALGYVKQAVPAKPIQPVLGMVLVEAKLGEAGQLWFTGTDLTTTIRAIVTARVTQAGMVAMPVDVVDVISRSATGLVQLVQSATETETGLATKLSLTDADRGSTTLAGMVGDEFPVIQVESPKRSLPAKVLLSALKACMMAAHPKDEKGIIHGVNLQLTGDTLICTATDGHRVAQVVTDIGGVGRRRRHSQTSSTTNCTLRLSVVKELCRTLTAAETETSVELSYDAASHQVYVQVPLGKDIQVELIGRCYEAPFPNVDALISRFDFGKTVTLNRLDLAARLERLEAVANTDLPMVQLRFTGTIVAFSKEEKRVQAQQVMAAAIDAAADGFTIGFNLYYLLSFVKAVDSSALQMEMGSAGGLVKLKAAGDTPQVELPMEIVYYLMPMQQRPKQ